MRCIFLITLFLSGAHLAVRAQDQPYNKRSEFLKANAHWAYGNGMGLDLTGSSPVYEPSKAYVTAGCATVSDAKTGQFLFYSNGGEVYNAQGAVMADGGGLLGNAIYPLVSSDLSYPTIQGVCAIPVIGADNKYYLFSLSGPTVSSRFKDSPGSLFYSIVDMNLENGLGAVDAGKKNIILDRDTLGHGMLAVPGNNCDIWLLVHKENASEIKAYRITKDGIDPAPVVSSWTTRSDFSFSSVLAISSSRQQIAIAGTDIVIGSFDPATGTVSGMEPVYSGLPVTSMCFSPGDTKLYFSSYYSPIGQLDLSSKSTDSIKQSLFQLPNTVQSALRAYGDAVYASASASAYLNKIAAPDKQGQDCAFEDSVAVADPLAPRRQRFLSFGSEIVYPLFDTVFQVSNLGCSREQKIELQAGDSLDDFVWDDGSSDRTRVIDQPGTYWLRSMGFCNRRVDTFIVEGIYFLKPVITITDEVLRTDDSYENYQWLYNGVLIDGATSNAYAAAESGAYRVIAGKGSCTDTSDAIEYEKEGDNYIPAPGGKGQLDIYPNPSQDIVYFKTPYLVDATLSSIAGKEMKAWQAVSQISIAELPNGIYLLQVKDNKGHSFYYAKIVKY